MFTVIGTAGNPHAVCLFPKESCTCPPTSRCYHIMAVRMSIGLESVDSKRRINLSMLIMRHNKRSKADKKSGRKAPRAGDYDVVPAPDSKAVQVFLIWVPFVMWLYIFQQSGMILTWMYCMHIIVNFLLQG